MLGVHHSAVSCKQEYMQNIDYFDIQDVMAPIRTDHGKTLLSP